MRACVRALVLFVVRAVCVHAAASTDGPKFTFTLRCEARPRARRACVMVVVVWW